MWIGSLPVNSSLCIFFSALMKVPRGGVIPAIDSTWPGLLESEFIQDTYRCPIRFVYMRLFVGAD
jgi:hypothetical protein